MRVGVCGYAMSGKDVAASALVERRGFVKVNMSDALMRDLLILDPLIDTGGVAARLSSLIESHGFEGAKAMFPDFRRMLQIYGTEVWRTIDEDTWVNRAAREAARHERVVTTGIRFPNELVGIDALVHVERPGVGPVNDHVSDTGIGDVIRLAQFHLVNDSTPEALGDAMIALIDSLL